MLNNHNLELYPPSVEMVYFFKPTHFVGDFQLYELSSMDYIYSLKPSFPSSCV